MHNINNDFDDDGTQVERTATKFFTTTPHVPTKKKRKANDIQNDFLKKCSEALSKDTIDEYDAVGINVSSKLKRMDPTQSIYADALINKVLTQGLLGQLTAELDICAKSTVPVLQNYEDQNLIQFPMYPNYSYSNLRPNSYTSNSINVSNPSPSIQAHNINAAPTETLYPSTYSDIGQMQD